MHLRCALDACSFNYSPSLSIQQFELIKQQINQPVNLPINIFQPSLHDKFIFLKSIKQTFDQLINQFPLCKYRVFPENGSLSYLCTVVSI